MLLITTTIRNASPRHSSGSLHLIDLEKRRLLDSTDMTGPYQNKPSLIPPPQFLPKDPNKRGGLRGLRGLSVMNSNTIAIANTVAIYIFDAHWNVQHCLEHPSCAGIHDIIYEDNSLWVTSTLNDLLLKIDLSSQIKDYFYFREHSEILSFLEWESPSHMSSHEIYRGSIDFRDPRNSRKGDNLAHLNSICLLGENDLLISLGFLQQVQQNSLPSHFVILRKKQNDIYPVLAMSGGLVPNHSLRMLNDTTFLFCDTNTGHVVQVCLDSHEITNKVFVDKNFLRGLCIIDETMAIVGSGSYIYWLYLPSGKVIHRLKISSHPEASVFDIVKLPSTFTLFPEHLKSS